VPSLGQTEQERAFQEWYAEWYCGGRQESMEPLPQFVLRTVRAAFVAGEQRGQELRGCCDHQERGGGA